MGGEDGVVLCGEWELGNNTADENGEDFNIVLPITEIRRHPDFDIIRGNNTSQYVENDVAVIFVNDEILKNLTVSNKINPACLPSAKTYPTNNKEAVHSGWSYPPSESYVSKYAEAYSPLLRDFLKQWHYSMVLTECRDPRKINNQFHEFRSDTYYPPGTLCANERFKQFCPTSGESGSALMMEKPNSDKLTVEGILSFVKGCSKFTLGGGYIQTVDPINDNPVLNVTKWKLKQRSDNPIVYTKLSCYLPWIASQYNMTLDSVSNSTSDSSSIEYECLNGSGSTDAYNPQSNANNTELTECKNVPNQYNLQHPGVEFNSLEPREADCIFPFIFNGTKYDSCVIFEIEGLVFPVFVCPIRTIRGQRSEDGVPIYTVDDIRAADGYCPTNFESMVPYTFNTTSPNMVFNEQGPIIGNQTNDLLELDPNNNLCSCGQSMFEDDVTGGDCRPMETFFEFTVRRPAFGVCKNNCPGVNFPVVSGGFALLTAGAIAAVTPITAITAPVVAAPIIAAPIAAAPIAAAPLLPGVVPPLAALGLIGVGGAASMAMCTGPLYCRTRGGQCCLIVINGPRFICPRRC